MRVPFQLAFVAVCASVVHAQDINIDFDEAGTPAGSPPLATFGGAVNQTGVWNAVQGADAGPISLVDTAGQSRGVVYKRVGLAGVFTFDNPDTSGEFQYLIDDVLDVGYLGSEITMRLERLVPGAYRVCTYAISPDNPTVDRTRVFVVGAATNNPQVVGGAMPVNSFQQGVTHALHTCRVDLSGVMSIRAAAAAGFGSVNGLQITLLAPARLYVRADAPPGGDGTGWNRAYRTLTEALVRSNSSGGEVREIWVARGTYTPSSVGDVNSAFVNSGAARVYAGFDGTETAFQERDLQRNPVVLSGRVNGESGPRSRWVVRIEPAAATLPDPPPAFDGFTIRYGGGPGVDGGGVRISRAGELLRCIVTDNEGMSGGGVRIASGDATLAFCMLHNNRAIEGGAVYSAAASVSIVRSVIDRNAATSSGGGLWIGGGGLIDHCLIASNTGGGVAGVGAGLAPQFANCTIAMNAGGAAPGVALTDTSGRGPGPRFDNCIIWGNGVGGNGTREQNLSWNLWPALIAGSRNLIGGYTTGPLVASFDGDPAFARPLGLDGVPATGDEDFTPSAASAAIDAGDNTLVRPDVYDLDLDSVTTERAPYDLAFLPRFADDPDTVDTGVATVDTAVCDIGAYEFQPTPACPADFNQDGGIDGADVTAFFEQWEQGLGGADVNQDGGVDGTDVLFFFQSWENGGC
ncbi:MAG: right-handed parallel beta-helix repeat-containing protein [Planctomycetes bacterium]|nr:right-handed parallel beta-helix repeat-containing protein [Planctomycetota bacterium]